MIFLIVICALLQSTISVSQKTDLKRGIRNYYTGKVSLGFDYNYEGDQTEDVEYHGGVDFEDRGTQQVVPKKEENQEGYNGFGRAAVSTNAPQRPPKQIAQRVPPREDKGAELIETEETTKEQHTTAHPTRVTTEEDWYSVEEGTKQISAEDNGSNGMDVAPPPPTDMQFPPGFGDSFGIFNGGGGKTVFGMGKGPDGPPPDEPVEGKTTTTKRTTTTTTITTTSSTTTQPLIEILRPTARALPQTNRDINRIGDAIEEEIRNVQKIHKKHRHHKKKKSSPKDMSYPIPARKPIIDESPREMLEEELRKKAEEELELVNQESEIGKEDPVPNVDGISMSGSDDSQKLRELEEERMRELREKEQELENLRKQIEDKKKELYDNEKMEREMLREKNEKTERNKKHDEELLRKKNELRERRKEARAKLGRRGKTPPAVQPVGINVEVEPPMRGVVIPPLAHFKHKKSPFTAKITPQKPKIDSPNPTNDDDEEWVEVTDEEEMNEETDEEKPKSFGIRTSPVANIADKPTGLAPLQIHHMNPETTFLGGWSDDVPAIPSSTSITNTVTPKKSLAKATRKVESATPKNFNEKAYADYARKYYEQYYREWSVNQTSTTVGVPPPEETKEDVIASGPVTSRGPTAPPQEIPDKPPPGMGNMNPFRGMMGAMGMGGLGSAMGGGMMPGGIQPPSQPQGNMFGIMDPRSNGGQELTPTQLNRLCKDIYGVSRAFGISNVKDFASGNCNLIKMYFSDATCDQIMHVMDYCESYFHDPNAPKRKRRSTLSVLQSTLTRM